MILLALGVAIFDKHITSRWSRKDHKYKDEYYGSAKEDARVRFGFLSKYRFFIRMEIPMVSIERSG
jgi:hypothetical protein